MYSSLELFYKNFNANPPQTGSTKTQGLLFISECLVFTVNSDTLYSQSQYIVSIQYSGSGPQLVFMYLIDGINNPFHLALIGF